MPECILILCGYIWEMKGLQSFPSPWGPFKDWAKVQFLHSEKYKAFFQFHLISWVGNKVCWWFSWQWLVSLASYQLLEGHNEKQLVKQQGLIQGNSTMKDSAHGGGSSGVLAAGAVNQVPYNKCQPEMLQYKMLRSQSSGGCRWAVREEQQQICVVKISVLYIGTCTLNSWHCQASKAEIINGHCSNQISTWLGTITALSSILYQCS